MELKKGDMVYYVKGPELSKYRDRLFRVNRVYSQNSRTEDDIAECIAEGWEDLNMGGGQKKHGWYKWRVELASGCGKCIYTCIQDEPCALYTEADE